jgi:hypothetical protein
MLTNGTTTDKEKVDTGSLTNSPSHSKLSDTKSDWILLNVGGRYFRTTRSTLSKENSFLDRVCHYETDLVSDHFFI